MTAAVLVLARSVHIGSAMLLVAFTFFRSIILRPVGTLGMTAPPS